MLKTWDPHKTHNIPGRKSLGFETPQLVRVLLFSPVVDVVSTLQYLASSGMKRYSRGSTSILELAKTRSRPRSIFYSEFN